MKKSLFCLLLFLGLHAIAFAKGFTNDWYKGAIALKSGEVYQGLLHYDNQTQLLRFKSDNRESTFSARQVLEFRYFNEVEGMHHKYRSFQYKNRFGYPVREFYEVVFIGKIDLLRKKRKHRREEEDLANGYDHLSDQEKSYLVNHILDFDYYFHYQDKFFPINRFHKDVLPLVVEDHPLLPEMIDLYAYRKAKKQVQVVKFVQLINCTLKEGCNDSQLTMLN